MEISTVYFGVTLIIVILAHASNARDLPSAGLLEEMPSNCTNMEFCLEKHENYPQKKIDELLSKKYQISLASFHEETGHRNGPPAEPQDCQKKITHGEIYQIIDQHDNVRVVVQSPKIFKQNIRIEQCVQKGRLLNEAGTKHFSPEDLQYNNISCVETKLDYSFLVLTRDGEGVESIKSKSGIPVCCMCHFEDLDTDYN